MTTLVVVVVAVMSAWHMVTVTRLRLQEAQSVAQVLADAMFQRVFDVVNAGPRDPYEAIQQDGGLRTILNSGHRLRAGDPLRALRHGRRARRQRGRAQLARR